MSYYPGESTPDPYSYDSYADSVSEDYNLNPVDDGYVPNYGIPAPLPERGHRVRNRVIAALTAAAVGVGGFLAFKGAEDSRQLSKAPTAAGKAHPGTESTTAMPDYNPAACVTQSLGEVTLDLACAERGFGAGLSPAVTRDLGAMVTVNMSVPIEYTPAQKQQILQQIEKNGGDSPGELGQVYSSISLSGERVNYNGHVETITAGHGNELFGQGPCAGGGESTVVAGGSVSQRGFAVDVSGFQTGYVRTLNETAGDIDFATVETTGTNEAEYDNLPVIPTETNAHPQIGELFEALTEEPKYGDSLDQEQNSPTPSLRQPRVLRLVYAGQDPLDPQNGVFIPLGAAEGGQEFSIGGASGSAIVSENDGVEKAMLVRGATEGPNNNETPVTMSGADFTRQYGTNLIDTSKDSPVNVQTIIGQFLPSENNTPTTECLPQ